MSQQAAYLRDGRTAVDAAQAARRHAIRSDVPALVSEAAAMEAHGHALRRDVRACLVAMRRAERTLDAVGDERRPPWLEYFDRAYLAAKFAHALHALGEAKAAERFAVRSLRMSEGYERGRLFNTCCSPRSTRTAVNSMRRANSAVVQLPWRAAFDQLAAVATSLIFDAGLSRTQLCPRCESYASRSTRWEPSARG